MLHLHRKCNWGGRRKKYALRWTVYWREISERIPFLFLALPLNQHGFSVDAKIGLAVRFMRGMGIKNKDNPDELSCLVAGGGLEPPTSGL